MLDRYNRGFACVKLPVEKIRENSCRKLDGLISDEERVTGRSFLLLPTCNSSLRLGKDFQAEAEEAPSLQ